MKSSTLVVEQIPLAISTRPLLGICDPSPKVLLPSSFNTPLLHLVFETIPSPLYPWLSTPLRYGTFTEYHNANEQTAGTKSTLELRPMSSAQSQV